MSTIGFTNILWIIFEVSQCAALSPTSRWTIRIFCIGYERGEDYFDSEWVGFILFEVSESSAFASLPYYNIFSLNGLFATIHFARTIRCAVPFSDSVFFDSSHMYCGSIAFVFVDSVVLNQRRVFVAQFCNIIIACNFC